MLFAQVSAELQNAGMAGVAVTIAGALFATVGGMVAAVMAYLTNRDKLVYDSTKLALIKDVEVLKKDVQECHQTRESQAKEYKEYKQETRAEIAQLRNLVERRIHQRSDSDKEGVR